MTALSDPRITRRSIIQRTLTLAGPLFLLSACARGGTNTRAEAPTASPDTRPAESPAASPSASPGVAASPAASPAAVVGPAASPAVVASSPAGSSCVLTPEQTEGPYYIDVGLIRTDITEGRPGVPLELFLLVQSAGSCQPVPDAVVEVWHCDALGEYSGFAVETVQSQGEPPSGPPPGGQAGGPLSKPGGPPSKAGGPPPGSGQQPTNSLRFLRGGQVSGRDGRVSFETVFPGWYLGRTVHIHVKVHEAGTAVHTGQLYFDEAISNDIYVQEPYSAHPGRDTTNLNDQIFAQGGRQSTLAVQQTGNGLVGTMTLTVQA